jgi:hypothetical protein
MRQLVWGIIFGAASVYFWEYYGDYVVRFKNNTMEWRNGAVQDTGGYRTSRDAVPPSQRGKPVR